MCSFAALKISNPEISVNELSISHRFCVIHNVIRESSTIYIVWIFKKEIIKAILILNEQNTLKLYKLGKNGPCARWLSSMSWQINKSTLNGRMLAVLERNRHFPAENHIKCRWAQAGRKKGAQFCRKLLNGNQSWLQTGKKKIYKTSKCIYESSLVGLTFKPRAITIRALIWHSRISHPPANAITRRQKCAFWRRIKNKNAFLYIYHCMLSWLLSGTT